MKKFLIICLANDFGDAVCKKVAEKLDIYYLNIDNFIQYALYNSADMLLRCGKDYYEHQEQGVLMEIADYENTVFFSSFETYIKNRKYFKNFSIIYLCLSLEGLDKLQENNIIINKIAFEDRDKELQKISSLTIKESSLKTENFIQKLMAVLKVQK